MALIIFVFFPAGLFAGDVVYIVANGDTIYSIARSFNVDMNELMRTNGITDPAKLRAGQRITIPDTNKTDNGEIIYVAIRGDTFYSIARRYGVSVNDILQVNNLSSNYLLLEGNSLLIPAPSGTRTASAGSTSAPPTNAPVAAASAGNTTAPVAPSQAAPSTVTATARPDTRAAGTAQFDTSIRWPINAKELSYMIGNTNGVIITGTRNESVKSLTGGTVISAGPYRGYGQIAIIRSNDGYMYVYGGCESLTVREGDRVSPGMEMGRLGLDPISGKPQLFFRVYHNNIPVDPAKAPRA